MSIEPSEQDNLFSGRSNNKRRNWVVVFLLLVCLGGAYYWQQSGEVIQENEPLIMTVNIGSIENTIASAGSLQPFDLVDVGAQVSGQLQKLHVEVGDLVEEGQLLAEIDARVQENRVQASRASIEAQEAQIESRKAALLLAEANLQRQERMRAQNASSQLEYDNAVNNLASAKSSLIQLEKQIIQNKASLASDVTELEYTNIYAPAAGTVVSIAMTEGRTLNASQQAPTILTIADLSTMTVETEISEADIGRVKKGLEVYFTTLGGGKRRWYSTLRQILPTPKVESNVVLYTGLFDIDNSDAALLSEMTAQVYFITTSAKNVLTVPVGALTYKDGPPADGMRMNKEMGGQNNVDGTGFIPPAGKLADAPQPGGFPGARSQTTLPGARLATVERVKEDGSIETRDVVIGVTSRVSAEVISGLKAGDKVVAGIIQAESADAASNNGFRGPPGGFGRF